MKTLKTIAFVFVLSMTNLVAASAQTSVAPTHHQIRHGMKPGHHGVPPTAKHGSSYKHELKKHPSAATTGNGA